jgi:hypothetical protein
MDNSFLRFLPDFDQAKDLQNSKVSEFDYDMQIHLKPGESYSLITNCPNGIAFDNLYKAYIVNCDNVILNNVSDNVFIEEFTNSETGLQQLKIEFVKINVDYFTDLCFFRLDHDIVNGLSYWSNPFIISMYDIKDTSRIRFKNYRNLDGTNYQVASIFQSIRLKCRKQKDNFSSSKQQYTTFTGLLFSSRIIKTKYYEFIFDMCNDFIYNRLQYVLSHDIIYIDTVRVTEKQTFENADKISETTNLSENKFKLAVNELDIDDEAYQVFEDIKLIPISKIPSGNYTLADFNSISGNGDFIKVQFNFDIDTNSSLIIKLYKNGVFEGNLQVLNIIDDLLIIDISSYDFSSAAEYSVTINSNSISTDYLLGILYFSGFVFGEWVFSIVGGDYDKSDYSNDYL